MTAANLVRARARPPMPMGHIAFDRYSRIKCQRRVSEPQHLNRCTELACCRLRFPAWLLR